MVLEEFLAQIQAEVRGQVNERMEAGEYLTAASAFTEVVTQHMADIAMTFDPHVLQIERPVGSTTLRLNGFAISDEADRIDLFVSVYGGFDRVEPISDAEIKSSADQCLRFLGEAVEGKLGAGLDPADDAQELILTIRSCYKELDQIRIYVLTDQKAKSKTFKAREVAGKMVRLEVMDIERLCSHLSEGRQREELVVNFIEVCGAPLPCVYVPGQNEDYDYALTAIPGAALRLIYEKYGPRLLEANVRSFLNQTGKVNKGIRNTLRDAPERFMAYNNGIVLIADRATLQRAEDGSPGISSLSGMQIVNGGQTTASIYFTDRRERGIDLSRVRVPAKIIVMHAHDPEVEEKLVSDISRFANSQNAVKGSDQSTNLPFHEEIEKLARTTSLPGGSGRWFYERAAGSYGVMLAREGPTPAKLRDLKTATPLSRRITKTDLAKCANAWAGKPQVVSLGAEKNFGRFMTDMGTIDPAIIGVAGYKQLIAQVILFRGVEKAVKAGGFQSYRANITAYSVALLSGLLGPRLKLETIWQQQGLSKEFLSFAEEIAAEVDSNLRESAGDRMVTEWAKKDECWAAMRAQEYPSPTAQMPELS